MIEEDIPPDSITFTSCIDAWSNNTAHKENDAPAKAESILQLMEQFQLPGNSNVEPTTVTYNVLIKAWSNSGQRNAGTKVIGVLQHGTNISGSFVGCEA
eukprot:3903232-Ditylum_brightwellii.AAC.2